MAVLDVVADKYNKSNDSTKSGDSTIQNPLDLVAKNYTPANKISRVGATDSRQGYVSQYDEGFTPMMTDQNLYRATRQPWTHQAGNALLGGVASGVMTAIEDVGYILDLPNNIKSSIVADAVGNRLENVESNWLSEWAKNNKESLNEALPIYRKDAQDTFDWNDSGFYFEMMKGMLDSAVGFGAVGMGAGALVKGLGTGIRSLSRLSNIGRTNAYFDQVIGKGLQQGVIGNASAAYITNFGESKLMALELYDQANENVLDELTNQFIDIHGETPQGDQLKDLQLKASDIAGNEANDFMFRNKLFMLTDYAQLGSIFKSQSIARDMLSQPGLKTWAKTQLKTAPKEGLEEIGQNVLQMEGQYQAQQVLKDEFGIEVDDAISQENDWVNRVIEFATSDQALLEGMMGLLSGPVQYGITTAPFQNRSAETERYNNQQATINKNKEFFADKANIISNRTKSIEDAVQRNQNDVADLMTESAFEQLVIENFERGSTEHLESNLNELLASPEYTDAEKQEVQTKLDKLSSMESEWNTSYKKYANSNGIFRNRLSRNTIDSSLSLLNEQKQVLLDNINTEFTVAVDQYDRTKAGQTNPISVNQIIQSIDNTDAESFKALPKSIKDKVNNSPNIQNYVATTKANIPALEDYSLSLDNSYNDMVKSTYQAGYDRLQTVINSTQATDDKINELNKLSDSVKGLKNKTLNNQINQVKHDLENQVTKAKELDTVSNETPAVTEAKVNKKSTNKARQTNHPLMKDADPNELPAGIQEEAQTTTELTPEEIADIETLKSGASVKAMVAQDKEELDGINSLSDEDWAELAQDPENLADAQAAMDEWVNLSDEAKQDIINNSTPVDDIFGDNVDEDLPELVSINEIFKDEITTNDSPKDPEVEVRNYNSNTTEVNNDLQQTDGNSDEKKAQEDVKVSNPPSRSNINNTAFLDWLENGVNPAGSTITYTLSTYNVGVAKTARDIFAKLKNGETVSKADKRFMIDNLPINTRIDGVNNASAFLFVVRADEAKSPEAQNGVRLERQLRTQIINNLLQNKLAQSTVKGQYGGNLKVTDVDVTITEIPDFKNGKVEDIPLMYVNGEGNLFDVETRALTSNPEFSNKKITLQSNGKPMAGAIFTTVRKANGELFPLKLNVRPLTDREQDFVVKLLKNIITPNITKQGNILNSKVPDNLLTLMQQADVDFLSENGRKSISYSMALNHLLYEGDRSKSNPVTQLLFDNGKIIFGDDEITLNTFPGKQEKLKQFLLTYKTRNVDLKKMNNDVKYKRHIINNGILTTNTDTSGDTLFEAENINNYGKDTATRTANRYKTASIYVSPELIEKAPDLSNNKDVKIQENISSVFKDNPELSKIGTEQEYANYLNTIFPNSKIKDVLHHWSIGPNISNNFGQDILNRVKGIWLSKNPSHWQNLINNKAKRLGQKEVKSNWVIINSKNVWVSSTITSPNNSEFPSGYNTIAAYNEAPNNYQGNLKSEFNTIDDFELVVKDNNQIHILGSTQDINGFKKYQESTTEKVSKVETPLDIKENIPNIAGKLDKTNLTSVIEDKLEENTQDMQLPTTSTPKRKLNTSVRNKASQALKEEMDKIKNSNNKNKDC